MKLKIYNLSEKFVIDSFEKVDNSSSIKHLSRTADWVKELRPDADEALLVAAISHDIERAYRQEDMLEKKASTGLTDVEFFRPHEERSAEIIANFLKKQSIDDDFIERVKTLVSCHEEGGNDDQNLLKDADSISFLENNIDLFLSKKSLESGKKKVRKKFDWMFSRISSEKAKQIAKPFYRDAIKRLDLATTNMNKLNVILVHGKDATADQKWYPWLRTEVRKLGIKFNGPNLPKADDPVLNEWLEEIEKLNPDENTIFVAHSRGGVAVLRWLEKQPKNKKVKKVILIGANNPTVKEKSQKRDTHGFYELGKYNFEEIKTHCDNFVVFHSEDDEWVPFLAGKENAKGLDAKFYIFKDRGHFGKKLPKQEIPELMKEIIELK